MVAVMRWPGHLKPDSASPQVMMAAGVLPTLAAAAGVPVESPKPLLSAANPERVADLSNRINAWRTRHPLGGRRAGA